MNSCVRILVADAVPGAGHDMVNLLEKAGYAVDGASSCEESLKSIQNHRPDILLLNRDLPGIEICNRIKRDPSLAGIFVVLTSRGNPGGSLQIQKLESGADEYIDGPLADRELLVQIELYVRILQLTRRCQSAEQKVAQYTAELSAVLDQQQIVEKRLNANQRQFAEAQRLTHIGSWHRNLLTNEIHWSDEGYRILGHQPGEIEPFYDNFLAHVHPEDRDLVHRRFQSMRVGEERLDCEFRIIRPDGSQRQVHCTRELFGDSSGHPTEAFGILQDITESRRAEQAQSHLAAIVEHSRDAITGETLDGTILSWNKAAEQIFGYTAQEAIGRYVGLLAPDEYAVQTRTFLERVARGERIEHFDAIRRRKDGTLIDVSLTVSPVLDAHGRIVAVSAILRDITERKRVENSLRTSQRRLTQAMDLARMANWEYDVATDHFTFDDRFYFLYGTSEEREGGQQMSSEAYLREFVYPGDVERMAQELKKAVTNSDPRYVGQVEQRIVRRDGELRHVLVRYEITRDAAGRPITIYGSNQDITESKRIESESKRKTAFLEALVNSSIDGVLVVDEQGRKALQNLRMAELLKIPRHVADDPDDQIQRSWVSQAAKNPEQFLQRVLYLNSHPNEISRDELELKDGTVLDRYSSPLSGNDGEYYGRIWTFRDMTERKQIEENLRIERENLKAIFSSSPVGMLLLDEQFTIVDANSVLSEMLLKTRDQIIHRRAGAGLGCVHSLRNEKGCGFGKACPQCALRNGIKGVLTAGMSVRKVEFRATFLINGEERRPWLSISAEPVQLKGTKHVIVAVDEISARKAMEEELRMAAWTDRLTGLPNRALFCDRLQQAALRAQRHKDCHFAVLFLDFDRFKTINDSLGHEIGDMLLQEISRRLRDTVRCSDSLSRHARQNTSARLGGDEFVVLLDGLAKPSDAILVANRLLDVLAQPYHLDDHKVYSTASIGVVTSDMAIGSADDLLRDADTAMYEAKLAGKGQCVAFDTSMRQRAQRRVNLENDLCNAIEADQLFLMYQPIISLRTGQIESFEALVRWRHPERGVISPGEFIPIAEDTGLILPIGDWVLREACGQFAQWRETLGSEAPRGISANLSRNQLAMPDLPETILQVLQETGMAPECLHLEVTESAVGKNAAAAIQMLRAIKAIGVKLDIDDFGTGYSSLACLYEFPIDVLKIDRSFVANMERGRDFAALVTAVTQLASALKISVVAEGIETMEQAIILKSLDCEFGQGYLFSRPLMADEVATYKVQPDMLPGLVARGEIVF